MDLKYQPFDYTVSGNENYYVRGSTMVRGNIQVDGLSSFTDFTETTGRHVYRLSFVLKDADTGTKWSVGKQCSYS